MLSENPVKINKINSQTANFQVGYYPILNETTFFTDLRRDKVRIVQKFGLKRVTDSDDDI